MNQHRPRPRAYLRRRDVARRHCPGPHGAFSGLSCLHSKSILYGTFVWVRRALDRQKRWFLARAVVQREHRAGGRVGPGGTTLPRTAALWFHFSVFVPRSYPHSTSAAMVV